MRWAYYRLAFLSAMLIQLALEPPILGGETTNADARDRAVEVFAGATASPPAITLSWRASFNATTTQTLYRRIGREAPWGAGIPLSPSDTLYADTTVSPGTRYEYRLVRTYEYDVEREFQPLPGYGHVEAGIGLPLVEERGAILLVVDGAHLPALEDELATFRMDLTGDGWGVREVVVSAGDAPATIRGVIQSEHAASALEAVLLIGSIPVVESGNYLPDDHDRLPHPADGYYGDLDGTWSDHAVNRPGVNVPGDGILDPSSIHAVGNGRVELQVGRIDMRGMTIWSETETQLLERYFQRNHAYRHALPPFGQVPRTGLVKDYSFGYFGGEASQRVGWDNLASLVIPLPGETSLFPELETTAHLWAYACGGGNADGTAMSSVTSQEFAAKDYLGVFNLFFGSRIQFWQNDNALLRAPLAGRAGTLALASVWANRPTSYFHPMATGATLGECLRLSQNNIPTAPNGYYSENEFTDTSVYLPGAVHMALMGDPTLRTHVVAPPGGVSLASFGDALLLSWPPSPDPGIVGYHVYTANSADGPYTRTTGSPVTTTSLEVEWPAPGGELHGMVRAVKLESSTGGTYFNASQGVTASLPIPAAPVAAWREAYFGSSTNEGQAANDADPDGDRCPNLVEYAMNTNPLDPDSHCQPAPELREVTVGGAPEEYLVIEFERDARKTDIIYSVRASSILDNWSQEVAASIQGQPTSGPGVIGETGDGPVHIVTVRDTQSLGSASKRFMRLRVEPSP